MKKLLYALFITAIFSLTFSSCGKYEDGPKISLASKKSRLAGDWKIEKVTANGTDVTSQVDSAFGANFVFTIEKDEKYTMTSAKGTDAGTWKLGEDKDDITFTSSNPVAIADTYRILRLKSKELWWKQTQANGVVDEYHYKQ